MKSGEILDLYKAGYGLIPMTENGPTVDWKQYQEVRPDAYEFEEMDFEDKYVAVLAGDVSGGVECIDIDVKNDSGILERFENQVKKKKAGEVVQKCTIQRTKSEGLHLIYKCSVNARSKPLARSAAGRTTIELRSNGGMFNVSPSPGYKIITGNLVDVATISPDERRLLLDVAMACNEKKYEVSTSGVKYDDARKEKYRLVVEKIIDQVTALSIDITADYHDWIKIGYGLANTFGEDGLPYYQLLCSQYPDYDDEQIQNLWEKYLMVGSSKRRATVLSLFQIAKAYGLDVSDDKELTKVEISKLQLWIIEQGYRWNEITKKLENSLGEAMDDFDFNDAWIQCRSELGKISRQLFDAHVFNYKSLKVYNPITSYFDGMIHRDVDMGVVDRFLSQFKLKDDAWLPYVRKWLVSVVAAAYGHPSELILVLLGPQHNGKTEFFLRLFPDQLRDYFAVDKLDQGKDSDILMTRKLVILDDEFGGKSKKDARHLKALVSKKVFTIRAPFGKVPMDLPRLAVLCGTSNNLDIINDNTGNRRILPVEVISREYDQNDAIDRDELWCALVRLFDQGEEQWKLTPDEVKWLKEGSHEYQGVNVERDAIQTHFEKSDDWQAGMTATDVCDYLGEKYRTVKFWPVKVGQELTELGYEKKCKRDDEGVPRKMYAIKVRETLGEEQARFPWEE